MKLSIRRVGSSLSSSLTKRLKTWSWGERKRLYPFSISHKLTLGFGLLVGLSLLVMGRNYLSNGVAATNVRRTQTTRVPAALTSARAESNLLRMSSHVRGYLATGDSDFRNLYHTARQDFEQELIQLKIVLEQDSTPENLDLLADVEARYKTWKQLPDQLFSLRDNYLLNEPALQRLKDEGEPLIYEIQTHTEAIIALQAQRSPSGIHTQQLTELASFQSSFSLLVSSLQGFLLTQNPSLRFEHGAHLIANQKAWENLQGQVALLTSEQQQQLRVVAQQRSEFMQLLPTLFDIAEGEERRQDLKIFSNQAEPLAAEMLDLLQQIVEQQQQALSTELNAVNRGLYLAQLQMMFGGALSLLFVLCVAWFLRRRIADPISRLIEATTQVMEGDFDAKARIESGDEIGTLATTFNQMTDYLKSRHELEDYSEQLENQAIALEKAIDEAKAANQAKSEFLANISHELRTPLNAILGFSQVMGHDAALSPQQQDYVGIINRSGEHLLTLLNDVLEMSKIEAGRLTLNETRFDLHQLLSRLEEMFQLKANSKDLQLTFNQAPEVPQSIQGDESKLRQILINLLGNAVKFTEQGEVTLTIEFNSSLLTFTVQDTGPGIAADEQDQLFKVFEQTKVGRERHGGTGLGLPISKEFALLMGGNLTVHSVVGQGTAFCLELPIEVAAPTELAPMFQEEIVCGLAPGQPVYRILVVDDQRDNAKLLVSLLETVGFEVEAVTDGPAAIDCWDRWQPHLIWMDLRMPGMDGYETTRQIRELAPPSSSPIIIALTADAFAEERTRSLRAGCDDFVSKPFKETVIFDKMAEYLGIQYVYQSTGNEQVAGQDLLFAPSQVEAIHLAELPRPWLERLHQAVTCADGDEIAAVLEDWPSQDTQLQEALLNLADTFQFEHILMATEPLLNR